MIATNFPLAAAACVFGVGLNLGTSEPARAASGVATTSAAISVVVDGEQGSVRIDLQPQGALSPQETKLWQSFRDALPQMGGSLAFRGRDLAVVSDRDRPFSLRVELGTTKTSLLSRRLWGCTGSWLAGLTGTAWVEVYGYLSAPVLEASKDKLEAWGGQLKTYVEGAPAACEDFDTETKLDSYVVKHLRSYLQAKHAGTATSADNAPYAWLLEAAYQAAESKAAKELHDQAVGALKAWTDGLKAKALEPSVDLALTHTLAALDQAGSMPAGHFALAVLRETWPHQDWGVLMGEGNDTKLEPLAAFLDTLLTACSGEHGVSADRCGQGHLGERVEWVKVKRSSGDFKYLWVID